MPLVRNLITIIPWTLGCMDICGAKLTQSVGYESTHAACTSSQFRCDNGQCVSSSVRCNGLTGGCSDGSDERGCCKLTVIHCSWGKWVLMINLSTCQSSPF